MTKGYRTNGKRIASQAHARNTWTCPCGRTVRGNGGKSSHQRACKTYRTEQVKNLRRQVADIDAVTPTWEGVSEGARARARQRRMDQLRELGATS